MSENDSWPLRKVLGIPASVITLLMGADWLWNRAAAIIWIADTIWSMLFLKIKVWHLAALTIIVIAGKRIIPSGNHAHSHNQIESDPPPPEKNEVSQGTVEASRLEWQYFWDGNNIKSFEPICPDCEVALMIKDNPPTVRAGCKVTCEECGRFWDYDVYEDKMRDHARREIKRNILDSESHV